MYLYEADRLAQPAPAAKPPDIVRICLIDPAGILKSDTRLREDFRSKLEEKFNNLNANWLKQQSLAFRVIYFAGDLSDDTKAKLGELDFPVYLLGKQHKSNYVLELMTKHRIPEEDRRTGSLPDREGLLGRTRHARVRHSIVAGIQESRLHERGQGEGGSASRRVAGAREYHGARDRSHGQPEHRATQQEGIDDVSRAAGSRH